MSYTISPVHTEEYFVKLAKQIEDLGADTICIKDMANLLLPYDAYSLVSKLKKATKLPIHLHTHNTTGTGDMVYLKAIEAGCDIVDTALSPLANGTSQPATESLVATLERSGMYDTGIDLDMCIKATDHFRKVAKRLEDDRILDSRVLRVDVNTLKYQVPGGMLSNLISQLKQRQRVRQALRVPRRSAARARRLRLSAARHPDQPDRRHAGRHERPRRRALQDGDARKVKGLMRGEYGQLPGKVNEEVRRKVIGDAKPITASSRRRPEAGNG